MDAGELGNQGQNEKEHGISCNSKSFFTGGLSSRISAERKRHFGGQNERAAASLGRAGGMERTVQFPRGKESHVLCSSARAQQYHALSPCRGAHMAVPGCGWACMPFLFSLGEDGSSFRLIIVFWLCVYSLTPDLLSHSGAVLLASVT
jgi:hypothetical protein